MSEQKPIVDPHDEYDYPTRVELYKDASAKKIQENRFLNFTDPLTMILLMSLTGIAFYESFVKDDVGLVPEEIRLSQKALAIAMCFCLYQVKRFRSAEKSQCETKARQDVDEDLANGYLNDKYAEKMAELKRKGPARPKPKT